MGGGGHFGGVGGGHFGGFHGGFGSRGVGAVGQAFHGLIAQGGRGSGAWHHDGGWSDHSYSGYYGYYSPFDYGLDGYAGPYYDDSESFDVQPAPSDVAPDESTSLIMSALRPKLGAQTLLCSLFHRFWRDRTPEKSLGLSACKRRTKT